MVERTIVDLNKAKRRRIAVWTPWGVVPCERARLKGSPPSPGDKRNAQNTCKPPRTERLAS